LKEKTNWMLTDAQLNVDRKKEKKKKKTTLVERSTYANPAANPAAQTQTQWGMRRCNRSMQ
jgi:hypothetical protein